jgi:hypothetical protein
MTKRLFVIAGILFAGIVGFFVLGVASNAPALLMLSVVCITPIFFMALGAAFGRASQEFTIARKTTVSKSIPTNRTVQTGRVSTQEPLG